MFKHIEFTEEDFYKIISSEIMYQEQLIKYIDKDGKEHTARSPADLAVCDDKCTVKVEGMERWSPEIFNLLQEFKDLFKTFDKPVTCHLFKSFKDGYTFKKHEDISDVIIYVLNGVKTMEVNEYEYIIDKNEYILIPKKTPHKATNKHDSMMLSIAFEEFLINKT